MYIALNEMTGNAKRDTKNVRAISLPLRGLVIWGKEYEGGNSVC